MEKAPWPAFESTEATLAIRRNTIRIAGSVTQATKERRPWLFESAARRGRVGRRLFRATQLRLLSVFHGADACNPSERAREVRRVGVVTVDLLGDDFLDAVKTGDKVKVHEDGTIEIG